MVIILETADCNDCIDSVHNEQRGRRSGARSLPTGGDGSWWGVRTAERKPVTKAV